MFVFATQLKFKLHRVVEYKNVYYNRTHSNSFRREITFYRVVILMCFQKKTL